MAVREVVELSSDKYFVTPSVTEAGWHLLLYEPRLLSTCYIDEQQHTRPRNITAAAFVAQQIRDDDRGRH